jgi:purine-binding chemotaxis protein CheW
MNGEKEKQRAQDVETRRYCSFYLSERLFGVDIKTVKEISSDFHVTRIYHAPKEINGYVNIRGQLFLVLDLKRLLGMNVTASGEKENRENRENEYNEYNVKNVKNVKNENKDKREIKDANGLNNGKGKLILFKTGLLESAAVYVDDVGHVVDVRDDQIEDRRKPRAGSRKESPSPGSERRRDWNRIGAGICKLDEQLMVIIEPRNLLRHLEGGAVKQ